MAIQDIRNQYLQEDGFDKEYILDLIQSGAMPGGGFLGFLNNQQTQAPTYDYGSYVIPASDPTYTSGFNYARTIAGGMPFEDVVAPGMSFSPEQPGGYTQADLNVVNLPRDVAPVFPEAPTTGEVFQPSYPTMPYAPVGTPMPERIPNFFGQLPQIDLSQIQLPKIDVSEFIPLQSQVTAEDLRSALEDYIPPVTTPKEPLQAQVTAEDLRRSLLQDYVPEEIANIDVQKIIEPKQAQVTSQDLRSALENYVPPTTTTFIPKQAQVTAADLRSALEDYVVNPMLPTGPLQAQVTAEDLRNALENYVPTQQEPINLFNIETNIPKAITKPYGPSVRGLQTYPMTYLV